MSNRSAPASSAQCATVAVVVLVPAALGVVGGAEAHEHRRFGHGGSHGSHDVEQEPRTVLERSAELVVALVRQGRQELVNQVAVSGVNFDEVEAGLDAAAGAVGERLNELLDARGAHRDGRHVRLERDRAGRLGNPAAAVNGSRAAAGVAAEQGAELGVGARLAPGVGELDRGGGSLRVDEVGHAAPCADLFIVPDAGVAGRDAALGHDRGRLRHDEAGAAAGERAEVHEVPVGGHAVLLVRRVLAERRHPEAVTQGQRAEGQGAKQRRVHASIQANRAWAYSRRRVGACARR